MLNCIKITTSSRKLGAWQWELVIIAYNDLVIITYNFFGVHCTWKKGERTKAFTTLGGHLLVWRT